MHLVAAAEHDAYSGRGRAPYCFFDALADDTFGLFQIPILRGFLAPDVNSCVPVIAGKKVEKFGVGSFRRWRRDRPALVTFEGRFDGIDHRDGIGSLSGLDPLLNRSAIRIQ